MYSPREVVIWENNFLIKNRNKTQTEKRNNDSTKIMRKLHICECEHTRVCKYVCVLCRDLIKYYETVRCYIKKEKF